MGQHVARKIGRDSGPAPSFECVHAPPVQDSQHGGSAAAGAISAVIPCPGILNAVPDERHPQVVQVGDNDVADLTRPDGLPGIIEDFDMVTLGADVESCMGFTLTGDAAQFFRPVAIKYPASKHLFNKVTHFGEQDFGLGKDTVEADVPVTCVFPDKPGKTVQA